MAFLHRSRGNLCGQFRRRVCAREDLYVVVEQRGAAPIGTAAVSQSIVARRIHEDIRGVVLVVALVLASFEDVALLLELIVGERRASKVGEASTFLLALLQATVGRSWDGIGADLHVVARVLVASTLLAATIGQRLLAGRILKNVLDIVGIEGHVVAASKDVALPFSSVVGPVGAGLPLGFAHGGDQSVEAAGHALVLGAVRDAWGGVGADLDVGRKGLVAPGELAPARLEVLLAPAGVQVLPHRARRRVSHGGIEAQGAAGIGLED